MLHREHGSRSRSLNLRRISFLVADSGDSYRAIVRSILFGFGAGQVEEAESVATAEVMLRTKALDFLVVSYDLSGGGGISLLKTIRADKEHPRRSIPIVVSMSAARRMDVASARDAGANFIIAKPISPKSLFDRLSWIAHHPRPYWDSESYYGPDRRFRPPSGSGGPRRRASDNPGAMESQLFEES